MYTLEMIKTRHKLQDHAAPMLSLHDFDKWEKDSCTVRDIMLSSIHFKLVPSYETYDMAKETWEALRRIWWNYHRQDWCMTRIGWPREFLLGTTSAKRVEQ